MDRHSIVVLVIMNVMCLFFTSSFLVVFVNFNADIDIKYKPLPFSKAKMTIIVRTIKFLILTPHVLNDEILFSF